MITRIPHLPPLTVHTPHTATAAALAVILACAPLCACGGSGDEEETSTTASPSSTGVSWISSVDWAANPAQDTDLKLCGEIEAPITADTLASQVSGVNIVTTGDSALTDAAQLTTSQETLNVSDTDNDAIGLNTGSCSSVTMSVSFALYTDETKTVADAFNGGWWRLALDSTSSTTIDSVLGVETTDADQEGASDVGSVRLNAIIRTYGAPTDIWYYASQFDTSSATEGGAYSLVWERDGYAFDIVVQDIVAGSSTVADAAGFGYYPAEAWTREKDMLQAGYEDAQGNKLTFLTFADVADEL